MRATLRQQKRSEALWGYLMIGPLFAGVLLFFYGGMLYSLLISFTDFNPIRNAGKFIFLENYQRIFSDSLALKSFGNTLRFVVATVPLLIIFSIGIAVLIADQKNPSRRIFLQTVFFIPNITLGVALALVWRYLFHPSFGIINKALPMSPNWFTQPAAAQLMIVLFVVWQAAGYCILLLSAAIQNIPAMYYEAALLEGASSPQKARYITVPLISPTVFFLVITTTIAIFQIFDPIMIITAGGPLDSTRSIMFDIYRQIGKLKIGRASAMSWLLFFIIIAVTLIQSKGQKKWVHYDL